MTPNHTNEKPKMGLFKALNEAFGNGHAEYQAALDAVGFLTLSSLCWLMPQERSQLLRTLAERNENAPANPLWQGLSAKGKDKQKWRLGNLLVEGDNLKAMAALHGRYAGKVKMIYIDPPYNTGQDFTYPDRFHHSGWFKMMSARLKMAKDFLRDDGCIFVSIDDNEVHRLRLLMDEIFGEGNFVAQFVHQARAGTDNKAKTVSTDVEYVVAYRKSAARQIFNRMARTEKQTNAYKNRDNDSRGPWMPTSLHATHDGRKTFLSQYTFPNGVTVCAPAGTHLRLSASRLAQFYAEGRIWFGGSVPQRKTFLSEVADPISSNLLLAEVVGGTSKGTRDLRDDLNEAKVFDYPKPVGLIRRFIQLATNPQDGDIVMDFFAGSGTTARAVMEQNEADDGNRQFLLVQQPEKMNGKENSNICRDVTYKRIHKVADRIVTKNDMWKPERKKDFAFEFAQVNDADDSDPQNALKTALYRRALVPLEDNDPTHRKIAYKSAEAVFGVVDRNVTRRDFKSLEGDKPDGGNVVMVGGDLKLTPDDLKSDWELEEVASLR